MNTKIRSSFAFALTIVFSPLATLAGTVLVAPSSVVGTSVGSTFSATNNGSGGAIQAVSVGGMALNASTHSSSGVAVRAVNFAAGSAITAMASGNTVQAVSQNASAFVGLTKSQNYAAGVLGLDFTTSTHNAGVSGASNGGYGVTGSTGAIPSSSGCPPTLGRGGVAGYSDLRAGTGVLGIAVTDFGCPYFVYGSGVAGDGNIGVLGSGHLVGSPSPSSGPFAFGIGLEGQGDTGALIVGNGPLNTFAGSPPALEIQENGTSPNVILAYNRNGPIMSLDSSGNIVIKGTLTQTSTPSSRGPQSSSGYLRGQNQEPVQKVGESALTYGQAYVRLDASWAHLMDISQPYEVFVTPNDPTAGLYVTERSLRGFVVRENPGGHSNARFSYRIVATSAQLPTSQNANVSAPKRIDTKLANRIIAKLRSGAQSYNRRVFPKLP